ncbi:hypothetical protein HAX54_042733, partial [Datura stramonium]|nr:hypothetical protein [Datura stramonium]
QGDEPSLASSSLGYLSVKGSSPFSLWGIEVPTNCQGSDGLSRRFHLGQKFSPFWLRKDGRPKDRQ